MNPVIEVIGCHITIGIKKMIGNILVQKDIKWAEASMKVSTL